MTPTITEFSFLDDDHGVLKVEFIYDDFEKNLLSISAFIGKKEYYILSDDTLSPTDRYAREIIDFCIANAKWRPRRGSARKFLYGKLPGKNAHLFGVLDA